MWSDEFDWDWFRNLYIFWAKQFIVCVCFCHFSTWKCHNQTRKSFSKENGKIKWKLQWCSNGPKYQIKVLLRKRIASEKNWNIYRLLRLLHYEWVWSHEFQCRFSSLLERKLCWYSDDYDNDYDENYKAKRHAMSVFSWLCQGNKKKTLIHKVLLHIDFRRHFPLHSSMRALLIGLFFAFSLNPFIVNHFERKRNYSINFQRIIWLTKNTF